MADEKTWCWFIIGEKERAERQREVGGGAEANLQVGMDVCIFTK